MKRAGFQPSRVRRRRVGVDEVSAQEVGLVGEPVGFGVEADADDAEEALAVGLADVDPAAVAGKQRRHRLLGLAGNPEHPRQVVAAAAGDDPERGLRAGHGAADRAEQPVAGEDDRQLAGFDRPQRLLGAVLEPLGALDPKDDAARVERLLDRRQQLQGLPSGRGRVDQQCQRHPLDVHALAA